VAERITTSSRVGLKKSVEKKAPGYLLSLVGGVQGLCPATVHVAIDLEVAYRYDNRGDLVEVEVGVDTESRLYATGLG
jgi:hypothetical protein